MSSSQSGKDRDANIAWMYEGVKSTVNREDYLLGKKVDKNLELYSDAIVQDKQTGFDAIKRRSRDSGAGERRSNLDVNIIRNEDPLVAIRVKEERAKQAILENPLKRLKFQKALKKAYEKKMKKKLKKALRAQLLEQADKKRESESDSDEWVEKTVQDPVATTGKEHDPPRKQRRRDSSSSQSDSAEEQDSRDSKQRDSHIPTHLRTTSSTRLAHSSSPRHSDSEDERRARRFAGYGLVSGKTKEAMRTTGDGGSGVAWSRDSKPRETTSHASRHDRRRRAPLSPGEIERRRAEMAANAKWRDEERSRTISMARRVDSLEESRSAGPSRGAAFIQPMLNAAVDQLTVEQRLQSGRLKMQRQHGHMDRNFAKR